MRSEQKKLHKQSFAIRIPYHNVHVHFLNNWLVCSAKVWSISFVHSFCNGRPMTMIRTFAHGRPFGSASLKCVSKNCIDSTNPVSSYDMIKPAKNILRINISKPNWSKFLKLCASTIYTCLSCHTVSCCTIIGYPRILS